MAFTQAQLDAIESAIASGQLSVSYEGKSVTFRSLGDLLDVRQIIRANLGLSTSPRTLVAATWRGFKGPIFPDNTYSGFTWGGP